MLVKVIDQITDDMHETAWGLYEGAFKEVRALAVQRHLMYRAEFDQVMFDPRVDKYLCLDDGGKLCGLSTYTNDLFAMPLIAPEYFERRWPDLYAQHKIWYCGFVAVAEDARSTRAFAELVEAMYRTATDRNGIIALDFCRYNDDSRNMVSELLRLDGYRLASAADGIEGYQLILRERPDVALIDIGLPGMDGYQVARKVRAELGDQSIRLVALTGYGRSEDGVAVRDAGFDEHLVKPVDPDNLARVLRKPK